MVIYRSYGRLRPPIVGESGSGTREPSRVIGYHNAIHGYSTKAEDESLLPPPDYDIPVLGSVRHRLSAPTILEMGRDSLPQYECTVAIENPVSIKFERTNPFESLEDSQWEDGFATLNGTTLSLHQLQPVGRISRALGAPKSDRPGRLIKQYTLQNAEVGVASDAPKHELIPRTLASAMWPQHKMKRMQQEAPHLFDHVRQYVIRLRLECDQILLRLRSWEERAAWIDSLCMAIDIAPPLEDRTEPKYHTLPRRRRHRQIRQEDNAPLSMTNLIEEQERIMRERFPHLLLPSEQEQEQEAAEGFDGPEDATADPEAEDLDSTVVVANPRSGLSDPRVQLPSLFPSVDRIFQARAQLFRPSESLAAIADSVAPGQKSSPATQLDRNQELRYRRRCMPSLLASSRRANDIVIRNGARWQIDWEGKYLKPYPEPPPQYECPPTPTEPEPRPTSSSLPDTLQALRTTPSSTTMNDGADSSLSTLENSSSSRTRPSKSWKDPASWSRRAKKTGARMEEEDGVSSGRHNSEGVYLHKLRQEHAETTFEGETLRMLGI